MTARTAGPGQHAVRPTGRSRVGLQALALVVAGILTFGALLAVSAIVSKPFDARPMATPVSYSVEARPAPPLRLTGADGAPFDLASLRGRTALVFFGYTHCPDVCPATIGILGQVLERVGAGTQAVFVSIDPERDTVEWLADYLRFLPPGFAALTGTPAEVRAAADAWGVRYARVDGDDPERYGMNHTATVYLVDGAGLLRAEFPFGTDAAAITEVVGEIAGEPLPATAAPPAPTPTTAPSSPSPTPTPSSVPATPAPTALIAPVDTLSRVEIVSSSVWAGGSSPVILALHGSSGRINDVGARVDVQLVDAGGAVVGASARAVPVRPPGVTDVSYVATVDVATPGWWRLAVTVTTVGGRLSGSTSLAVLEPGGTAQLGAAAPVARTPTLADVGGEARRITTDPMPDLRLYQSSTAGALGAGQPFVLVIDSWRFRTTDVCGQAISLGRFLLDRWPGVPMIHLEPFEYTILSDTPVLSGTLADPPLVPAAEAWGIGAAPWDAASMPWIFVVDGAGVVRAKYQGVIGSADVDVILALLRSG